MKDALISLLARLLRHEKLKTVMQDYQLLDVLYIVYRSIRYIVYVLTHRDAAKRQKALKSLWTTIRKIGGDEYAARNSAIGSNSND